MIWILRVDFCESGKERIGIRAFELSRKDTEKTLKAAENPCSLCAIFGIHGRIYIRKHGKNVIKKRNKCTLSNQSVIFSAKTR